MRLVDTGYLVALARKRDALHPRARAWAKESAAARVPLLVTEYVLWEFANALSSPADRPKLYPIVRDIRAGRLFVFLPASPQLLDAGLALHAARAGKEWSLTDCVSFHVMHERGLTRALAHDHHFAQAGYEPLMQRDP